MPVLMILIFAAAFIFLVSLRFVFQPLGTIVISFFKKSDELGREMSKTIYEDNEREEKNHGK